MTTAVKKLMQPYLEGRAAIIHSGRDLYDLEVGEDQQLSPLIEILRTEAFTKHNLVMIEFSKSSGVSYDLRLLNNAEKGNVTKCLSDIGICASGTCKQGTDEPEFVKIIRSLLKLSQSKSNVFLRDGIPLKFLVLFHFQEHMTPQLQTGTHSEEQLLSIETVMKLAKSLGVRKYGNYVIFSEARIGTLENLIYQNVPVITLPQPAIAEKKAFIEALKIRYPNAKPDNDLPDDVIANLSAGTPHRSTEAIYLASEKTGEPINSADVFAQKQSDIISLSENTLEAIDQSRVKQQNLVGATVNKPMSILMKIAEAIKKGDKNCLRNVMLCGSPSGGKTVMANIAAAKAGVPAFYLNSPKNQYVGESERKAKLMFDLLKQLGGFGIIDEVELIFPLNRNQSTGDSGVTQNIQGQLQSFLSDPSLSGKTILVGTSNRPNAISEAMRQRWTIVPVLMPLASDFPTIVLSIAKGLNPSLDIQEDNETLIASAKRFYMANAAPREIREALIASMAIVPGDLEIKHIEFASFDIIPSGNINASVYADYCALVYCRNNSFLPWWDEDRNQPNPEYNYPDYIKEILTDDFRIDQDKLRKQIQNLEPQVNV